MTTLFSLLSTGFKFAASVVPKSYVGQLIVVSVGGSWASGAFRIYDYIFNTPYAILRDLLFSSFGTASLIVLTATTQLAAKTTYLILKGTAKGKPLFSLLNPVLNLLQVLLL